MTGPVGLADAHRKKPMIPKNTKKPRAEDNAPAITAGIAAMQAEANQMRHEARFSQRIPFIA